MIQEATKPTDELAVKGQYMEWGGKRAKIVYVNEAYPKANPDRLGAYTATGDCLWPQLHPYDEIVVADGATPKDGDIVTAVKKGFHFLNRYRAESGEIWLESRHGKRHLDEETTILGVVMLIGRRSDVRVLRVAGTIK